MPGKSAKSPKPEKEPRIYVAREKLSRIFTLRPPNEFQRSVLATGMVRTWPDVYEMFPTEDIKQVLTELDVSWSDQK